MRINFEVSVSNKVVYVGKQELYWLNCFCFYFYEHIEIEIPSDDPPAYHNYKQMHF
jgi:hypothetical protein